MAEVVVDLGGQEVVSAICERRKTRSEGRDFGHGRDQGDRGHARADVVRANDEIPFGVSTAKPTPARTSGYGPESPPYQLVTGE